MGCFRLYFVRLVYFLRKSTEFHVKRRECQRILFHFLLLIYHDSCNRCAIPDEYVDEDKVGLKVEDGEEQKEEDDNDLEVSDEDIDGMNDDKEQDMHKKTKEEMPRTLASSRESQGRLCRETLQGHIQEAIKEGH